MRHQPAADVAYKPGVDVRGRPVKSADLDGSRRIELPAVIVIPLHVPLGDLLKKGSSTPVDASEVGVGVVTFDRKTGQVMYEGKSLQAGETRQMVTACRKLLRGK